MSSLFFHVKTVIEFWSGEQTSLSEKVTCEVAFKFGHNKDLLPILEVAFQLEYEKEDLHSTADLLG